MEKQLSLSDIINIQDTKEERFPVPEWGGFVVIRQMTAEARDAYEQSLFETNEEGDIKRNLENMRAKMLAACVLGPDGQRMFKTDQHIKALGSKSGAVVDRIFTKCQQINAISDQDIEEMAGN